MSNFQFDVYYPLSKEAVATREKKIKTLRSLPLSILTVGQLLDIIEYASNTQERDSTKIDKIILNPSPL